MFACQPNRMHAEWHDTSCPARELPKETKLTTFFAMLGVFALNVLTPGASFVLTVSNAMNHGQRSGLFIALGLATADTLFAVAATAGLATLLGQSIFLVKGISLLGGLWFIQGGLRFMLSNRTPSPSSDAQRRAVALSASHAYRIGLTAGMLNAQAIIFFSSLFLTALSVKPPLSVAVALVVGVACVSVLTRCNIVLVATVKSVANFYAKQRRRVEFLSGSTLTAFGLKLAVPAATALAARLLVA
ncbi:LysE family transporter [Paraburkholderia sp. Ac-20336]|uniref:LysE family translocator n=1 Tax=unclassified Paraburkholderia TaxID=2615204 RepID=UPI0019816C40|nr:MULTISPECIES: LysE family translocator [unclassified Paraburkholderia]MBN3802285.1 LysE family transporter [Paraburkholderia sp. Ac-20336]MBN3845836.1 LysE family transporter [Paraburkholderia sp. Ac-20342]NIF55133.1 hypothetical protein [Burkholderia sp. Ax-1724]NIF77388.1 hypothetical protein [Paraburkholderia sp. Cy-641]